MKILCVDGHSVLNRAFYGIKLLTTKDGQFTNAIFGFMNILLKLEQEEKPDAVAIAFDLKAPTFRHKMFDGYKAQRKGMPEELRLQLPVLKELLLMLGYKIVTCEGYEADDILGTFASYCKKTPDTCVIATGDRDSLQLVGGEVRVLLTTTVMGRGETVEMDETAVRAKYGVSPKQLIEVKALMGDASDNIPGVAGVGEKTAIDLIQKFGDLAGVYSNIESPDIKAGVRDKLLKDEQTALLSRKLAEIYCEVPIDCAPQNYVKTAGEQGQAFALLSKLEMTSIINKLGLSAGAVPAKEEAKADGAPAPQLTSVAVAQYTGQPLKKADLFFEKENVFIVCDTAVYSCDAQSDALLALLGAQTAKRCFDAKAFYKLAKKSGASAQNITFCAKLAAHLLNPAAAAYGVQNLVSEYGMSPLFNCDELPYAGSVQPLFDELAARVEKAGMANLFYDIELPLSAVLADMEHTGIGVDINGIRQFGEKLAKELARLTESIYGQVGYEFNLNSPKQLGEALFVKLGLPSRKKTKTGFSTDAETLDSLKSYHPAIEEILKYRIYQKLNSTYVEGLMKAVKDDGRIHSNFNQTETRTGRISSDEPNLQNIPVRTELGAELRKFFVAGSGNVLLDADYSQIELRILAHISDDEGMLEAFRSGEDIHRTTAAKIFGLPLNMVTAQLRSRAKAVNFGIVYGIGAFSLAKDTGVTVKEADAFIKSYLEKFSGVKNYMDKTVADATQNGYVTTLYGRRRPLPELASSNRQIKELGKRMAMNTPIQGTAADIMKIAMVRVAQALQTAGLKAKLILQVHDELIVEAPEQEAQQAAAILGSEMMKAAQLKIPLVADVGSGTNWYSAKE